MISAKIEKKSVKKEDTINAIWNKLKGNIEEAVNQALEARNIAPHKRTPNKTP